MENLDDKVPDKRFEGSGVKQIPDTFKLPEAEKKSFLEKAKSMGKSYISRGVLNKKASESVKSLRVLSCHGDETFLPCPYRKDSEKIKGSYYCGACGCGDKVNTQLTNNKKDDGSETYSKLDFPLVFCPLKMPGFSDYINSDNDSEENKNFRKMFIENKYGVEYISKNSVITPNNGENNESSSSSSPSDNEIK